jgi:hypothetical protein
VVESWCFDVLLESIKEALKTMVGEIDQLYEVTSLEIDGIMYTCKMAVVTDVSDGVLQFAQIQGLYLIRDMPYMVVCKLD